MVTKKIKVPKELEEMLFAEHNVCVKQLGDEIRLYNDGTYNGIQDIGYLLFEVESIDFQKSGPEIRFSRYDWIAFCNFFGELWDLDFEEGL